MRKILLALVTAVIVGIVPISVLPCNSYATKGENINVDKAMKLFMLNDTTLLDLNRSIYEYRKEYESALSSAEEVDLLEAPNYYSRMLLLRKKVLVPEQRKHNLISAEENVKAAEIRIILNLRGQYWALLNAKRSLDIQREKYALDVEMNNLEYIKHKLERISDIDMEEAEYNYLKAQTEITSAVRNYENACRNFNLFIGSPIETFYDKVEFEELDDTPLYDISFYLEEALKNRPEVKSIQRQIYLKNLEKEILETNQVHITYTSVKKQHQTIVTSINTMELQLEKTMLDIKKEVYSAFVDVIDADDSIKRAEKNLENEKRILELARIRYNAGVIPEINVKQAEIRVREAEMAIKAAVYNYNTQLTELHYAAGLYSYINGLL